MTTKCVRLTLLEANMVIQGLLDHNTYGNWLSHWHSLYLHI